MSECKGMNCGTTTGEHSPECLAQHAAVIAGGRFVKGVPVGPWRLVPVEPTAEMLDAGRDTPLAGEEDADAPEDYKAVYAAMLAAAPLPPAVGPSGSADRYFFEQGYDHGRRSVMPPAVGEIHRYQIVHMLSADGNKISYKPHGPDVVMAEKHDAAVAVLSAQLAASESRLHDVAVLCATVEQQLAASQALIKRAADWIEAARDGVLYPVANDFDGVIGHNADGLGQLSAGLLPELRAVLAQQVTK